MKVDQEKLVWGLDIVRRAVARRSTLPILSHVLLVAGADGLTLGTNDLGTAIACDIPGRPEEDEEWALTVPHRFFTDYVKELSGEISIKRMATAHTLYLTCPRQEAHIKGMEKKDFPKPPVFEGELSELSPATMKHILERTLIAASTDEYRLILTAVLLSISGNNVETTAADGFRLSRMSGLQDWELASRVALVPGVVAGEVLRISDKVPDEVIKMGLTESHVFFEIGPVRMCAGLIEGIYPDTSKIIPKSWGTQVAVPTKELKRALRTLKGFALSAISFEVTDDAVLLSAQSPEEGDVECQIDATVTGEKVTLGIAVKYLIDVLQVVDSETVVLEMTGTTRPVVVRPEGMDRFTHVIMPAQLGSKV